MEEKLDIFLLEGFADVKVLRHLVKHSFFGDSCPDGWHTVCGSYGNKAMYVFCVEEKIKHHPDREKILDAVAEAFHKFTAP